MKRSTFVTLMRSPMLMDSVARLVDFWNFLVTNLTTKVA